MRNQLTRHKYGKIGEPLSVAECAAIRMLHIDGWSIGRLRLAFGLDDNTKVEKHINNECEHSNNIKLTKLKELTKTKVDNHNLNNSDIECTVIKILNNDGWDKNLLLMIFEFGGYSTLNRHIQRKCSHKILTNKISLKQ